MMIKKINSIIFSGLVFSLLVASGSTIDNCVKFSVNTDRQDYYAGENLFLELNISIDSGYHIYSVDPTKSLSSSYIEFSDTTLFSTIGIIHEPATHTKYDSTFNIDIHYHENKIRFIQDLKIINNLSPGNYKVTPIFEYYACNPKFCVPKFEFPIFVTGKLCLLIETLFFETLIFVSFSVYSSSVRLNSSK